MTSNRRLSPQKYRTIVADPPWDHSEGTGAKWKTGYPVMSVDEIKALPVGDLSEPDDAHLYLWVTNKYLRQVWAVAEAWGFRPVRLIVWCKEPLWERVVALPTRGWNPGGTWPSTAEFCLYSVRGVAKTIGRAPSQWYVWPRQLGPPVRAGEARQTMHSAKPEAFLDEIERVSPGPYLELFARRQRLGWDTWGNEAFEHVQLKAEAYQRQAEQAKRAIAAAPGWLRNTAIPPRGVQ